VAQGYHFLGDVIAGSLIGTVVGAGSFLAVIG
jgi:hypothetical protein